MQYRLLRLTHIEMDEKAMKLNGRDLENARDADGVVDSIDALSHMLGFEEDEPGLYLCQLYPELKLDRVSVNFRADRISDLDWVLALGSRICYIKLVGSVPKITGGESGARFPRTKSITIYAPPTEKSVGEESLEEWIPLLSHIIDSCPDLDLTVCFKLSREDLLRSSYIDVVAKLRDSVFPRLPQETETEVWVRLTVTMQALEYEALMREHGDEINRTFDRQRGAERDAITLLWREVHWDRGEGLDPWVVTLLIPRPDDDD